MKKIIMCMFTLIIGVCFTATGLSQEKTEAVAAKPAVAADTSSVPEKAQTKKTTAKKTTKKKTTKKKQKASSKKSVTKKASSKPAEKPVDQPQQAEPAKN
jgi:hypothetical protein